MMVDRPPFPSDRPGADEGAPTPIRLPVAPIPERGTPVSLVVLAVPAAIAVVMFFIIGSPYVLMFAVFSPLLALGGVFDRRVFGRRRMRIRRQGFEAEVAVARTAIDNALRQRRDELETRFPSARHLATAEPGNRLMFRTPGVVLGWATQPSGLRCSGGQPDSDELLQQLQDAASVLEDAPVVVAAGRIVVHPGHHSGNLDAVLRALYVSAYACAGVGTVALLGCDASRITRELSEHGYEPDEHADAQVEIQVLDEPNEDSVVARIELQEAGLARCSIAGGKPILVRMGVIGGTEFDQWLACRLLPAGQRAARLPEIVRLSDLHSEQPFVPGAPAAGLAATFTTAPDAPFPIDLVTDGPHALVAGTTGSGKSELLISWACSLAARYDADALQLLCLDFKGGATFDLLATLPHCAGIVTDLDGDEAIRVSASLLSEVRRREHALRDAGIRDLAASPRLLPRLVVFVDEYQALLAAHPQLQAAFADVAARGRSLGMHLVLCTQRPGGVFRDALLANATLRLCLRVEEAFDSVVLLGTDAATKLPAKPRGRLLVRHGGTTDLVQVALSDESFTERITRAAKAPSCTTAALWHPPLPHRLSRSTLQAPAGTIAYAAADLPEEQTQPARWLKPGEPPLAILGQAGSGRSTALHSIAAGSRSADFNVAWVEGDVEGMWDALQHLLDKTYANSRPTVAFVDDLDQRVAAFDPEYRAEFIAGLLDLAREHRVRNCTLVVSLSESGGEVARLLRMCGSILRLSHVSRQAWTLSGGESQDWQDHWPPGRGRLGRDLVQVALPDNQDPPGVEGRGQGPAISAPSPDLEDVIAVVTRDVERLSRLFTSRGRPTVAITGPAIRSGGGAAPDSAKTGGKTEGSVLNAARAQGAGPVSLPLVLASAGQVIIAEPEQWQAKFGLLAEYARSGPVVVHGVTPGEFRSLFRGDPLPPPLADRGMRAWLRSPGGEVSRVSVQ